MLAVRQPGQSPEVVASPGRLERPSLRSQIERVQVTCRGNVHRSGKKRRHRLWRAFGLFDSHVEVLLFKATRRTSDKNRQVD